MAALFSQIRKAISELKKDALFAFILESPNVRLVERPEYSALSMLLGDMEYERTTVLKKAMERRGYTVLSLVRDGVYLRVQTSFQFASILSR